MLMSVLAPCPQSSCTDSSDQPLGPRCVGNFSTLFSSLCRIGCRRPETVTWKQWALLLRAVGAGPSCQRAGAGGRAPSPGLLGPLLTWLDASGSGPSRGPLCTGSLCPWGLELCWGLELLPTPSSSPKLMAARRQMLCQRWAAPTLSSFTPISWQ